MATMREVAERAGVSLTTVSHVINGPRFVSEAFEACVREAIDELDYRPDRRARSLHRGRSETIAVINERGGYEAATHLIELGHRRIGAINEISGIRSFDDRIRGWESALNDAGIEIREGNIRQAGLEIEGAAMAAKALLSNRMGDRITAVFTSSSLMTLGLLRYPRTAELRCPEDVSLVGFDDPP